MNTIYRTLGDIGVDSELVLTDGGELVDILYKSEYGYVLGAKTLVENERSE